MANSVELAQNFALHARRILSGSDACIETVVRLSEHALQMPPLPVLARFGAFRRPGETTIPITHKHNSSLPSHGPNRLLYRLQHAQQATQHSSCESRRPAGRRGCNMYVKASLVQCIAAMIPSWIAPICQATNCSEARPVSAQPTHRTQVSGILCPGMHQESLRYYLADYRCTSDYFIPSKSLPAGRC